MTTYKRLRTDLKDGDNLADEADTIYPACVAIARALGRDDLSAELATYADNPANMNLKTAFDCVLGYGKKHGVVFATAYYSAVYKNLQTFIYNQLALDINTILGWMEEDGL